jgi:hypothetical protein
MADTTTRVAPADARATQADRDKPDVPSIIAPGPWIAFGALGLGIAFEPLHRFGALAQIPPPPRNVFALLAISYGG